MVLPVSHPHQRYSVAGYREQPDGEVIAWSCELLRHGQSIGLVSNDGRGGANTYAFTEHARGQEFRAAAARLHPDRPEPQDRLVDELITIRQMNALDQVAYCFAEDRFEDLGEHRLADPGLTFEQVREALATRFAERRPRIWDKRASAMVPVSAGDDTAGVDSGA